MTTSPTSFAQKKSEIEEQVKCPITLLPMRSPNRIFPCRHVFEGEAIQTWLKKSQTCPIDRSCVTAVAPDVTFQGILQKFEYLKRNDSNQEGLLSLEQQLHGYQAVAYSTSLAETQARISALEKRLLNPRETGLYLFGNCENSWCPKKDLEMTVFKGTGRFSMNKVSATALCQNCYSPMAIDAIAILGKDYQIDGMKISQVSINETRASASFEEEKPRIISPLSEWKFLEVNIDGEEEIESESLLDCFKNNYFYQWIKNTTKI